MGASAVLKLAPLLRPSHHGIGELLGLFQYHIYRRIINVENLPRGLQARGVPDWDQLTDGTVSS